jgi:hypothetical protein
VVEFHPQFINQKFSNVFYVAVAVPLGIAIGELRRRYGLELGVLSIIADIVIYFSLLWILRIIEFQFQSPDVVYLNQDSK